MKSMKMCYFGDDCFLEIKYKNKNSAACTILLRSHSNASLDEYERAIHDAICILTSSFHSPSIIAFEFISIIYFIIHVMINRTNQRITEEEDRWQLSSLAYCEMRHFIIIPMNQILYRCERA